MNKIPQCLLACLIFFLAACSAQVGEGGTSTPQNTHNLSAEEADHPTVRAGVTTTGEVTHTHTPPSPGTPTPTVTASPTTTPPPSPTTRPAHHLFPDAEIVYSPTSLNFDTAAYLETTPGLLSTYQQYLMITGWTPAAEVVERVALENSINPRLLLALLEYQSGCVFGRLSEANEFEGAMGANDQLRKDLYGQLVWAAHVLSEGFYGWWEGKLAGVPFPDGSVYIPSQDANPGTVALQYFFAQLYDRETWERKLDPQYGFPALYEEMFGDPWGRAAEMSELLPEDLRQPYLSLPFEEGVTWAYTSGPHRAFENNGPLAALDFAPPMDEQGCLPTKEWVTASTNGLIVRSELGTVIQDVDGDGNEQTGWVILYLHIAEEDRVSVGDYLFSGEKVGHPSCEGGISTGTHVHIARKYNGVWIPADGDIPFVMNHWTAHAGERPREGTLTRGNETVTANPTGWEASHIARGEREPLQTPVGGE